MKLADLMGFPLSQKEWMEKRGDVSFDPAILSGGLDLCHVTVAPPFVKTMEGIAKELCWFLEILFKYPQALMVKNQNDLRHNGLKIIGGLQHPPEDFSRKSSAIESLVTSLERLRGAGVIFSTLAYELENVYGGGFATPEAPLTKAGKSLLTIMAHTNMVLDLSHAGEQSTSDVLDLIEHVNSITHGDSWLPVIASHTGCRDIYGHPRNFRDDTLRRIADLGGVVGITTATFLNDVVDDSNEPFYRHIEHALNLLGEDAVCVGTDSVYKKLDLEEQKQLFEAMKQKIDPSGNFRARFPDQPEEFNTPAKMIKTTEELQIRFGTSVAEKIAGENFFNFLSRVLPEK